MQLIQEHWVWPVPVVAPKQIVVANPAAGEDDGDDGCC